MQSIANMVNALHVGYEFYIFTSNTDLDELPLQITITNEWVRYNAHTRVWYALHKDRSQQLTTQLEIIKPDYLYMVGLFSWHFTMVPLFFGKADKKILSVRGMLHPGALGEKATKKKIFLQLMSWVKISKKCAFQASDKMEAGHIRKQFGESVVIHQAGNFPRVIGQLNLPEKTAGVLRIISIALISPMKNIKLVLEALQHTNGNINYDIYGPVKEMGYWEECLELIHHLPSHVTVTYHNELTPVLVPQKLATAQVFILPSKSENFGHSIFEALSAGLPVITSNCTPWNGLEEAKAGINVETDSVAVAKAIDFFVGMDSETFLNWNKGALLYAGEHLDTEGLKTAYGKMFGVLK